MQLADVPSEVESTHGFPIAHETLQAEFGGIEVDVPDGPSQELRVLLDTCSDGGFEDAYTSPETLKTVLLTCADRAHVGRAGYDDRGSNPTREDSEQVSF